MASSIVNIVMDCENPWELAQFWSMVQTLRAPLKLWRTAFQQHFTQHACAYKVTLRT